MIHVYFNNFVYDNELRFKQGKSEIAVRVHGHAEFGKKGFDIVCSAVSAVVQTAIVSITKVAKIRQVVKQDDSCLETYIPIGEQQESSLFALIIILNSMLVGLKEILNSYPGTLKIIIE